MTTTADASIAALTPAAEPAPGVSDVSPNVSDAAVSTRGTPTRRVPLAVVGMWGRARSHGVTGPAVVALEVLLLAMGVAMDLPGQPAIGAGVAVTLLVAAAAGAAVVRYRSLLTAVALPPLLLLAAATTLAQLGGQDRGRRELVLDIGTALALSAPLAFAATALALVIAIGRGVGHLTHHRH